MISFLLVFFGGGLGASFRHGVNLAAVRVAGVDFPWGTLIVNVSGSLLMGLLAGYLAFRGGAWMTQHARLFLATGVLGGYTTFSAFSLESMALLQRGAWALALAHTLAHVLGSLALAGAGWALGQATIGR
jgi:CrcB protein